MSDDHGSDATSSGAALPTRASMRAVREAERAADRAAGRARAGEEGAGLPNRASLRVQREASRRLEEARRRHERRERDAEARRPDAPLTRRSLREQRIRRSPWYLLREIVTIVVLAVCLSFGLKTWLVQPFLIPSGSMEATLQVGDRVLVSKLTPDDQPVQRGDIVVFKDPGHWLAAPSAPERNRVGGLMHDALVFVGLAPSDSDDDLIKRVVGLPGDHVKCCTVDGKITVNGTPITEPYIMPGDVPSIDPFDIRVPEGRLWVLGDHRSDSGDSRYHPLGGDGTEGSVPIAGVVGRAVAVVWPFDRATILRRPTSVFTSVPDPRD